MWPSFGCCFLNVLAFCGMLYVAFLYFSHFKASSYICSTSYLTVGMGDLLYTSCYGTSSFLGAFPARNSTLLLSEGSDYNSHFLHLGSSAVHIILQSLWNSGSLWCPNFLEKARAQGYKQFLNFCMTLQWLHAKTVYLLTWSLHVAVLIVSVN